MIVLPLGHPQYLDLCDELGPILALYQTTDKTDEALARIQALKDKAQAPEVKSTLAVIQSLMKRNETLNRETFKQDFETEKHYLELYQKNEQSNQAALAALDEGLVLDRQQLEALQSKTK